VAFLHKGEGRMAKGKSKVLVFIIIFIITIVGIHLTATAAESPPEFYKGKTVVLTVGSSPAGGYDTWARLVARSLGTMIGATVVVKNMPEAGGVVALDDIYHTKNARGLKIHLARDILPPLIEATDFPGTSARWEVQKLQWLARLSVDPATFAGSPKKYKSMSDVRKAKEFLCGVDAAMSVAGTRTAMAFEALGLDNAKMVAGYPGGSERRLAVMQGELGGTSGSYDSLEKYFASGDLVPLWVMSKERLKEAPGIPTVFEIGVKKERLKWLEWQFNVEETGRTLVAPPDTPLERVKFLRAAMAKVVTDPEFLKNVAQRQYSVDYLSGDQIQGVFAKVMKLNKKDKEELIYILKTKYMK
jgi:tripartite-type tricarboxylate transporter receptor subunit TctC